MQPYMTPQIIVPSSKYLCAEYARKDISVYLVRLFMAFEMLFSSEFTSATFVRTFFSSRRLDLDVASVDGFSLEAFNF